MIRGVDIKRELSTFRKKNRKEEDHLLREVDKILHESVVSKKNVLNNLKHYNASFELVNEDDVDDSLVFTLTEIKQIAIKYRLRFIDSQCYKFDFPYEGILKIEEHNKNFRKDLKAFKLLGTSRFFKEKGNSDCALLFAPTTLGNYYLIHKWGKELKWNRAILNWPLKNIETLFVTLLIITALMALAIPTYHLVLDRKAEYWSSYRIGIFFHILIFNMAVTAYVTFAFSKNLASSIWDREKDF